MNPRTSTPRPAIRKEARIPLRVASAVSLLALVTGCSSVGVGIGIPLIPGVSVGVGVSNTGVSVGAGVGAGPVGAGVGVNQRGQVTGGVGVGASTPIGGSGARVGVGVGTGTVLYDPQRDGANRNSTDTRRTTTPGSGAVPGVVVPAQEAP